MSTPHHDIEGLSKKITDLSVAFAKLGSDDALKQLPQVVHRPGWTSIAEYMLVTTLVDHLAAQARHLADLKGNLVKACEAVGHQG